MPEIATSATPILGGTPDLDQPFVSAGQVGACWPLRINWSGGVENEYEFKTDIFRARGGREQRRALRLEPRKSWKYSGVVALEVFRDVFKYIARRYDEISYFPDPFTSVKTDVVLSAGTDLLSVPTALPWWITEGAFVILTHGDTRELVKVRDVSSPTFRINGLLLNTFPVNTRVCRAEPIRVEDATSFKNETRGVATVTVKLLADPVLFEMPEISGVGDLFDGRELFLKRPNWREGLEVKLSTEREVIEVGRGPISVFSPIPYVDREYRGAFVGREIAEAFETIDFFCRQRGRRGEFFMPTGTADIKPALPLVSGAATLTTAGVNDFATHTDSVGTGSEQILKAVYVELTDGTYIVKKIASVALSGGNSVFTMDSNWSANVALSQIRYISYLPLCRFAGDTLTIQWTTRGVAQFNLTFRTLEYQAAE